MADDTVREIKPHAYWPDCAAMGDCLRCGRDQKDPVHVPSRPLTDRDVERAEQRLRNLYPDEFK